ncbi:MAG: hypothetical protein MI867_03050 [Pseudomonadales bacterium]|nr:hypothetical protein [Pseudomonadales bacterium]
MATLNQTAQFEYGKAVEQQRKESVSFDTDCLVESAKSMAYLSLGGLLSAALLIIASNQSLQVLAATSAVMTALYFANLSESRHIRDFLGMTIPAIAIIALVLWEPNNSLLIGFSLLVHVTVSFSNALKRSNGVMSELNLWPGLLGFQAVLLGFWIFTF